MWETKNRLMQAMVASKQQTNASGINYTTTAALSPRESQRNYAIQLNLSQKNFQGLMVTRVELPQDEINSQQTRERMQRYQIAQPWQSHFMNTATDKERLNNPAQYSNYNRQRRLVPPNTYGQFYAFMHALSAAFGTLQ